MANERRFSIATSVSIDCRDSQWESCVVKMSVRNDWISLAIGGGDEWAHLNQAQARRLAKWLLRGAEESEKRRVREDTYRAGRK